MSFDLELRQGLRWERIALSSERAAERVLLQRFQQNPRAHYRIDGRLDEASIEGQLGHRSPLLVLSDESLPERVTRVPEAESAPAALVAPAAPAAIPSPLPQ